MKNRSHRARSIALALLFTVAAATQALAGPQACLEPGQVTAKLSPVDLWEGIEACVTAGRYDAAVFLYAVAGSFARFDVLRVADDSAHRAAAELPRAGLAALPKPQAAAFRRQVQATLGDDATRGRYCVEVLRVGPPDYLPGYMLREGIGGFNGASDTHPFVDGFDPKSAWPQAVKEYLECPAAPSR
ncbi:MAG: hypothetical protein KGL68_10350 [Burkholderiales bacterium]|nr:hypothetical protein [Burkholderiales bacterium]